MVIDYRSESEKYRPHVINTLLVGEAPPASGKTYFYVPRQIPTGQTIENDKSLPATIFHHYFGTRPRTEHEYTDFLLALRDRGVFLVDICDEPIKVRNSPEGVCRIISEIPGLGYKLRKRGIVVPEDAMVFLLARRNYESHIRRAYPKAVRVTWKYFKIHPEQHLLLPLADKSQRHATGPSEAYKPFDRIARERRSRATSSLHTSASG
jgi:hypothetical protein